MIRTLTAITLLTALATLAAPHPVTTDRPGTVPADGREDGDVCFSNGDPIPFIDILFSAEHQAILDNFTVPSGGCDLSELNMLGIYGDGSVGNITGVEIKVYGNLEGDCGPDPDNLVLVAHDLTIEEFETGVIYPGGFPEVQMHAFCDVTHLPAGRYWIYVKIEATLPFLHSLANPISTCSIWWVETSPGVFVPAEEAGAISITAGSEPSWWTQ